MTAAAIPGQRALRDPAGACIADERQDLDNAGFADRVTAVAAVFAAAGLGRGGVLAIMVPNRVELVTSMFAAWRLGAAVTPVNPALTAQEARYQIGDAGAALVIADGAAAALLGDGPYRIIGLDEVTAAVSPPRPRTSSSTACHPWPGTSCRARSTSSRHCPRTRSGKSPSQCSANG